MALNRLRFVRSGSGFARSSIGKALVWLGLLGAIGPALSAGGGGAGAGSESKPAATSSDYRRALAAIDGGRFGDAIAAMESHLKRRPDDADGHNWLAYAYRKSGRLDPAFEHYRRALELMPGHLGAHEYIGEAYLQAGQPDKAAWHLGELARLCASSCEQYFDLKKAIERYRAAPPAGSSGG